MKRNTAVAPIPDAVREAMPKDMTDLEIRRAVFNQELKNSNNRHRLLSERLGVVVYKIPDELWERSFSYFQVTLDSWYRVDPEPF